MGLISSIYERGHESRAHYSKGGRSSNWANVPKNKMRGPVKSINKHTHAFEMEHGYANGLVYALDGSRMADKDMLTMLAPTYDPLMEIMK